MENASILRATLFGSLTLEENGTTLLKCSGRLSRPQELLALLLLEPNKAHSSERLMECLWAEDETENPAGTLKNTVYNLRRQLAAAMPGRELILSEKHAYRWNPACPVQTDVMEFQRLAAQAVALDSAEERIAIGLAAAAQYSGELLPGLGEKHWVAQQAEYLRTRYMDVVCGTAALLMKKGSREALNQVLELCNRAVLVEPFSEELYEYLFRAMRQLEMKNAVLKYYPVVTKLFWETLGIRLSDVVQEIYHWAAGTSSDPDKDIGFILSDLNAAARGARPLRGAYYCPYEVFVHMFNMVARSASRENNSVVLMLLTLQSAAGQDLTDSEKLRTVMANLQGVIEPSLRKGDVFSQYSRSQFVLLLSVKSTEDCPAVENRLRRAFAEKCPQLDVTLTVLSGVPEQLV